MSAVWRSSSLSDVGKIRSVNEDACLELPKVGLWLVADGMGGHSAGDFASRAIIESFGNMNASGPIHRLCNDAKIRLFEANRRIREKALQSGAGTMMGSTVVTFLAHGRDCICLWVGDSRAYVLRGGSFTQITADHSVVEELIQRGKLRKEDAADHDQANVLTRAVGVEECLKIDECTHIAEHGDKIVLCSDGLNKEMTDHEIAEIVDRNRCDEACRLLVETTLARGAKDNVTVAVMEFSDNADSTMIEWSEN